jgi:hypothetical protein
MLATITDGTDGLASYSGPIAASESGAKKAARAASTSSAKKTPGVG